MEIEKILYIDLDGVIVNFSSCYNKITEDEQIKFNPNNNPPEKANRYDEIPYIFSRMEPYPEALKAIKVINESKKYEIFILSTSPWNNSTAWSDKLCWVKKYLVDTGLIKKKRLILSHSKFLNRGKFLIDDRKESNENYKFDEINKDIEGKLLHLHPKYGEYKTWDEVLDVLLR